MSSIAARTRAWVTARHVAQVALVVQPLIVFRTAGEYLRLVSSGNDGLQALLVPLFVSIAAVAVVTIVSLLFYFNNRDRAVIALTAAAIVGLIAYKLMAMPGL